MKLTRVLLVIILFGFLVVGLERPILAEDDHNHASETHEHHEQETSDDHGDHHEEEDHHDHNGDDHEDEPEALIRLSEDQMREFGITVQKAEKGIISKEVIFPGEVQIHLDYLAHVKPRYSGVVKRIYKHIGDKVKKGDVLAVVESNENLSRYEIKAPMTGTIIQKHFTLGESVEESSNAFAITNLNKVWVMFSVSEDFLGKVKEGQLATVLVGDKAVKKHIRVSYVSDVLDMTTRTSTGRLEISNRKRELKPGMYVDVSVELDQSQGDIVIPKTAVQKHDGKTVVFVRKRGGFQPHPVTLGEEDSNNIIILNGIEHGETIVTQGSFTLKAELGKGSFGHGHAH
jgi:cobalt-zinc-cadmium efflux system membrane fusion protein